MMFRTRDDDTIDQNAGNLDVTGRKGATLGQPLDLHDHDPAGIVRGHRQHLRLKRQRLALHSDIAFGIGSRAAQNGDMDREGLVG